MTKIHFLGKKVQPNYFMRFVRSIQEAPGAFGKVFHSTLGSLQASRRLISIPITFSILSILVKEVIKSETLTSVPPFLIGLGGLCLMYVPCKHICSKASSGQWSSPLFSSFSSSSSLSSSSGLFAITLFTDRRKSNNKMHGLPVFKCQFILSKLTKSDGLVKTFRVTRLLAGYLTKGHFCVRPAYIQLLTTCYTLDGCNFYI